MMNKFIKPLAVTLTSISLLAAAPITFAVDNNPGVEAGQGHAGHHGPMKRKHHKGMLKKMARQLGLSEQQKQEIKTLMVNARQEQSVNKTTLESFHQQMKVLMQAEQFDEQAFLSLRQQYSSSFEQIALAKAKTRHAISRVLTDEQRAKWQSLKEKRVKKIKQHKAKRRAEKQSS